MSLGPLAMYFGELVGDVSGHHLRSGSSRISTSNLKSYYPKFPWTMGHLDGGLLRNRHVLNEATGHVHWTCGGLDEFWIGFFWWDLSGCRRPGSNSGFYVRGFGPVSHVRVKLREAFDFACAEWPHVVKRQQFPFVLID